MSPANNKILHIFAHVLIMQVRQTLQKPTSRSAILHGHASGCSNYKALRIGFEHQRLASKIDLESDTNRIFVATTIDLIFRLYASANRFTYSTLRSYIGLYRHLLLRTIDCPCNIVYTLSVDSAIQWIAALGRGLKSYTNKKCVSVYQSTNHNSVK